VQAYPGVDFYRQNLNNLTQLTANRNTTPDSLYLASDSNSSLDSFGSTSESLQVIEATTSDTVKIIEPSDFESGQIKQQDIIASPKPESGTNPAPTTWYENSASIQQDRQNIAQENLRNQSETPNSENQTQNSQTQNNWQQVQQTQNFANQPVQNNQNQSFNAQNIHTQNIQNNNSNPQNSWNAVNQNSNYNQNPNQKSQFTSNNIPNSQSTTNPTLRSGGFEIPSNK
jgi:hypothetical protein